jgi:hypothetical protein
LKTLLFRSIALFFLFIQSALAASAYDYSSSIHVWLRDGKSPVVEDLEKISTAQCISVIRQHLNAGDSLASQKVVDNSIKVRDFPKGSTLSEGILYHWTGDNGSESFKKMEYEQNLDPSSVPRIFNAMFDFPKQKSCWKNTSQNGQFYKDVGCGSWPWYLYLAGDKRTSHPYGEHLFEISLYMDSKVFFPRGDVPGKTKVSAQTVQNEIEAELISRYSDLSVCNVKKYPGQTQTMLSQANAISHTSPLVMLAIEASGVSLIAHYGVNNASNMYHGPKPAQWIQAVGAWSVKKLKFLGTFQKHQNP